jgi:Carboxypeptidase regulatory-like domain/TonB dependent receptor
MSSRRARLLFGVIALLCPSCLVAQATFGGIFGTVVDSTGAVVVGAKVTMTDVSKGVTVSTSTNESGNYSKPYLTVGTYKVSVEAKGFKSYLQENVPVSVDNNTRVDAKLEVGDVNQEITVSETPPLIQSDRAEVSDTLQSREISQAPIANRNFTQLELMMPGTTKMSWQHASSENPQGGIQINTNGQLFGMNNFMIDGADNNDPVLGIIMINPAIDSVQEFKLTSANYDAEFAQAGGSVIQVETKSGTNELHGSLFEFLQNNIFEARDPFTQGLHDPGTPAPKNRGVPPLRWNQFGGSIGGPILKNKLFFFGDYQGTRRRTGASVLTRVPTAAERQGDFSDFSIPIFDPLTGNADGSGRVQFADPSRATASNPAGLNIIPISRIAPQATNLLGLLPAQNLSPASPNDPNYVASGSEAFDSDQYDIRIDHYPTDNLHYFGRYSLANFNKNSPPAFGIAGGPGLNGLNFAGKSDVRNQNLVGGLNYTLAPSLLTDVRFTFTRYRVKVLPLDYGQNAAEKAGLPGLNLPNRIDTSGLPELKIGSTSRGGFTEGFGLANDQCNCPLIETENVFQGVNNWTKVHSNHTFKWGTDLRYANNIRLPSDTHRSGSFNFNDSLTASSAVTGSGLAAASFLLGLPSGFARFAENAIDPHDYQWRMFFFLQDTWRVTSKLTLNYGLRWDTWFPNSSEHAGEGGRYEVTTNLIHVPGVGKVSPSGDLQTQWHNFSPRFSAAYSVTPRTVVRAGWGRSYFQGIFGWTFNNLTLGYPTLIQQQISPASSYQPTFPLSVGPPLPVFPTIPPNGLLPLPDGITAAYVPVNLKYPYVDAWNVSLAQQVAENLAFELAYVGNVGRHLNYNFNLNAAVPGPGDLNPRRPLFNLFGLTQTITDNCDCASSSYNALQVKGTRRFSRNYSLIGNLTWSRAMDFGEFGVATNSYNYAVDKGPADFDRAVVFNLSHEVILPFGPGQKFASGVHGFVRVLVEGWQWTGITSWLSGYPFSPVLSNNASLNSDMSMRPDIVGNPRVSNPSPNGWFNPAAYAIPAPYVFGDASRNSLRGPGAFIANWSFFKNFKLNERINLQFRWENFNIFNRQNLALPTNAVDGGSAAGKIFDVAEPMRNMQFALRLTF